MVKEDLCVHTVPAAGGFGSRLWKNVPSSGNTFRRQPVPAPLICPFSYWGINTIIITCSLLAASVANWTVNCGSKGMKMDPMLLPWPRVITSMDKKDKMEWWKQKYFCRSGCEKPRFGPEVLLGLICVSQEQLKRNFRLLISDLDT